ncbi:MAG TPA: AEC family transporter [Anaeromyxobacteraceae bacterium]|nr:AEC family transporter [Anaeromyxobacteraceae bacterium]
MNNLALLAVAFLAGILLRRTGRFPDSTPIALNGFVIHVSLPAVTLLHLHRLQLDRSLVLTALMPWLFFGAAWVFYKAIGRAAGLKERTIGALILVTGLGNTSFVGLPMIEAWYGKEWIGVGVVADQLGSFLVLSTLGILTATAYSSGATSPRELARRVVLFPPFQALVVAVLLRPFSYPDVMVSVLQKLADTLTPLALASVGFQLRFRLAEGVARPLGLGLLYKLVLGPALVALLYVVLLRDGGPVMRVTIFEAAMAPMITAGIIAADHDLDPPLVSLLVGVGIPLSFLTLAGWWWILRAV